VVRDITQEVQAYQLLEQRVQVRTRELAALLTSSQTLVSTLELRPLLDLILDQVQTVVDYTGAHLYIREGESDLVLLRERTAARHARLAQARLNIQATPLVRELLAAGGALPVIVPDTTREIGPDVPDPFLADAPPNPGTWMVVPLLVKDRAVGLLRLEHNQAGYYDEGRARLVMAFANQAAAAIENARLYEQGQQLAALEERQRLARDLHDSVSQALYGIGLGARTARSLLGRPPVSDEARAVLTPPLDYVLSLAEAGLAEMRALIFELRPESLESEGLVAALTKQADSLQARHGLRVEVDLGHEPKAPLSVKEALYRITQEALHNIAKHARAARVALTLARSGGHLHLSIVDDGQGFDPEGEFPGHLGLRSMRERAERLGGQCFIDSAPGQGTRLHINLPI
jgi:signal transduction histidine kinase